MATAPDHAAVTTEYLHREIDHLKELMDEKFRGRDVALAAALTAKTDNRSAYALIIAVLALLAAIVVPFIHK